MLTQQSTIRGKYHRKTGYLLRNIDAGIWEFAGTGYHVDDVQTTWTDESQMMTSHQSCTHQSAQINHTNESHKTIAENKMTSRPGMEMTNDAFGCSKAIQVHMEDLRLVDLTEICPSRRGECLKAPC